ncbi:MAG: rRNA maturation RNase YbeY [Clostridia bacterium]
MNINIDLDGKIIKFLSDETKKDNNTFSKYIEDIVYFALLEQKIEIENIFISIKSANEKKIKQINKDYRNIDKVTDVLSFPIFDADEFSKIINEKQEQKKMKAIELGDIVICLDRVKQQSIEYKTGILREMLYMITHGVCHLLGYDHQSDDQKTQMRKIEENILDKIGVGKNE